MPSSWNLQVARVVELSAGMSFPFGTFPVAVLIPILSSAFVK